MDFHRCLKIAARSKGMLTVPLECSSALGMVAAEARLHVAVEQAARTLHRFGTNGPVEEERLQAEQNSKMQRI